MDAPLYVDIVLAADYAPDEKQWRMAAERKVGFSLKDRPMRLLRKSLDARQKTIKCNLRLEFGEPGSTLSPRFVPKTYKKTGSNDRSVVIVGAGPAGLFAALHLLEQGIRPIVVERGKDVRERRRDLAALTRNHIVDPDSNYCFGEGGAGTYSDGKLYTRSTKRGDVQGVLETLVQFGADENILIEAHPHIGTNKLPGIITAMRECIIAHGGEVHFGTRLEDIEVHNGGVEGVRTSSGFIQAKTVVLATGHSARDIFRMLYSKGIAVAFKPFAMGVRAEHPQSVIDAIQYRCEVRPDVLPPAAYSLVEQVDNKGVYSFCMCPGGIIAPCATAPGEIVTNGWSPSKRNNPFANSGIVVPVEWADIAEYHSFGSLAGIEFQSSIEKRCWEAGGRTQVAPAQRIVDFIQQKKSESLPPCSYTPGVVSAELNALLPSFIAERLREGFKAFDRKMKGYLHPDAILVATESRTSSPVRIPRDDQSLEHPEIQGLYPCGEGAGYAGGIVSAAIDGVKVASAISGRMQ
jgi:uncharacterized protein